MSSASAPKPPKVRRDPKRRSVQGIARFVTAEGTDPSRKYIFANKSYENERVLDLHCVHAKAEEGYVVERYQKDSKLRIPGVSGEGREGQPIEQNGMVLMSCPKEQAEELDMYGPGGDTGQAFADRLERDMKKARRAPVRGVDSTYIRFQHEEGSVYAEDGA